VATGTSTLAVPPTVSLGRHPRAWLLRTPPPGEQICPELTVADNTVSLAWQDNRAGNWDIFLASSNDRFATCDVTAIATDPADQTEPTLATDTMGNLYLAWTDRRRGNADIFLATSTDGLWINTPLICDAANQSEPALAVAASDAALHLAWVDHGIDQGDILYATWPGGLPPQSLQPTPVPDDTSNAPQYSPTLVLGADPDETTRVFMCWQDDRNLTSTNTADSDIYFAEGNHTFGADVLVTADGRNTSQSSPAAS